jgi:hypothetical protein
MKKSQESTNGANGMSDVEGKAVRVAASECGQRVSFNRKSTVLVVSDDKHLACRS